MAPNSNLAPLVRRATVLLVCLALLCGCGRFGPPLSTASLSAKAVKSLSATGETGGVRFTWESSDEDLRGKEVKTMDGYEILRKVFEDDKDLIAKRREFATVGRVEDTHIAKLKEAREDNRKRGIPSHRAKLPADS